MDADTVNNATLNTMRRLPVKLGTSIPHFGEIAAVGTINGERYYWLTKKWASGGVSVAMLPWHIVEARRDKR